MNRRSRLGNRSREQFSGDPTAPCGSLTPRPPRVNFLQMKNTFSWQWGPAGAPVLSRLLAEETMSWFSTKCGSVARGLEP